MAMTFEQVPIVALAVAAICPIGIKARALTLLKRNPSVAKTGTENIKKAFNCNSLKISEKLRKMELQPKTHNSE